MASRVRRIKCSVPVAQPAEGQKAITSWWRKRTRGQALIVVATVLTLLILFVGLAIDAGNLMSKRAKLQSAVDTAVLSAAQMLAGTGNITQTATTKAYQVLSANGIPTTTLNIAQTEVDFPAPMQIHMQAVQHVDTFFMRLVPIWRTVDVSANATADLNSYAEINFKPFGQPGVVNELNISVWGVNSFRRGGDAYSPQYYIGATPNPEYTKQPYGYLYRIDVPPDFINTYRESNFQTHLAVQIFDPDSFNRPDLPPTPPAPPTPTPPPTGTATVTSTATPPPTPTSGPDGYAYTYCPSYDQNHCTTGDQRYNTGLKTGAYVLGSTNRSAFWRVDEERKPHDDSSGDLNPNPGEWSDSWATTTQYTLWHFDPHITNALVDPATLSDQPGGAYLARYTGNNEQWTDLRWYQPDGFDIKLRDPNDPACNHANFTCFAPESNGGFYFYLYVQGTGGSSEDNFDLRAGPTHSEVGTNDLCDRTVVNPSNGYLQVGDCYINMYNYDWSHNSKVDWTMGDATRGARVTIFAKRAMVLNLDTGDNFPMLFTQLSKNAEGQLLGIRHFDQDCTGGCGPTSQMTYQLQKCVLVSDNNTLCRDGGGAPCQPFPLNGDPAHDNPGFDFVGTGYVGPNDDWACPGPWDEEHRCPSGFTSSDPEPVQLPYEGSAQYAEFFGPNGECPTSWLRLQRDPSYTQDTTVWEMPFLRPRLIK